MSGKIRLTNRLIKLAQKGFRGWPVATVAYYGPDDRRATKVAVGIIAHEGGEATVMRRWFAEKMDARMDDRLTNEILSFIRQHQAASVAAVAKILGCPHEEGTDYPEGEACPQCPFWAGKDRWADLNSE